ncbi:CD99 molecule isoform X3 [Melanotaenia boesemani]|uniref:CD99 molecule isoform X3 n=1 Tax=Melanotaenia boesemani TaxID=1250792 RepID=UPI001C04FD95|nr:CD99 molecule isoform X3 [Melanotaenia boesemani]
MKSVLRFAFVLFLVSGTLTQDEFDLSDALGDPEPSTAKPKEQPKAPGKPNSGGELDLSDAFGPDDPPTKKPKKPSSGDFGGPDEFDLSDALKPDPNPKPDKPADKPTRSGGGGGSFGDSDLLDVADSGYKPDGGRSGGRAQDPAPDHQGGADQPQDPDLWDQILKKLNANIPEEFYVWLSNLKQILTPLVDRVADLLQALP